MEGAFSSLSFPQCLPTGFLTDLSKGLTGLLKWRRVSAFPVPVDVGREGAWADGEKPGKQLAEPGAGAVTGGRHPEHWARHALRTPAWAWLPGARDRKGPRLRSSSHAPQDILALVYNAVRSINQ